MAFISLDNMSLWKPPVDQGGNSAGPSQKHAPSPLSEGPSQPLDGQCIHERETLGGQSQNDPITIMSDAESTVSDIGNSSSDQDDGEDSDSSLPSISTLMSSLAKTRPDTSGSRQPESRVAAETGDLAQWPQHPDSLQRLSPSLNVHGSVTPLPPAASSSPSPKEPSNPERASCTLSDAMPASARMHETPAIVSSEKASVLSEGGPTPRLAEARQPPLAGAKRKLSLKPTRVLRNPSVRKDNSEAQPGFDSGSSDYATDKEGGVLNRQQRLAQTSGKRHKGSHRMSDAKRLRSHSTPVGTTTRDSVTEMQSALPSPEYGTDSQSQLRITSMRRSGSFPMESANTSLDTSTPPPRPQNDLAAAAATFQEWPLRASLKRVMLEDGRATFQLQFDWDPDTDCEHLERSGSNGHATLASVGGGQSNEDPDRDGEQPPRSSCNSPDASVADGRGQSNKFKHSRGFTSEENQLLIKLKDQNLRWSEITTGFNKNFPERERSQGCLQVHYSTKLKQRNAR